MDVGAVADLGDVLNGWWQALAVLPPKMRSDDPELAGVMHLMHTSKIPFPQFTGGLNVGTAVLWTWAGDEPRSFRMLSSPTDDPDPMPGLTRLAKNPITSGRPHVVLPAPWQAPPVQPSPLLASCAVTSVLTLHQTAVLLDQAAGLPSAPFSALRKEADTYRATAETFAQLLPAFTAPWVDQAQADVLRAAQSRPATTPQTGRRYPTTPVTIT